MMNNNVEALLKYLDFSKLIKNMSEEEIIENFGILKQHIPMSYVLLGHLSSSTIMSNFDRLRKYGVDVQALINSLNETEIINNLGFLLDRGGDANELLEYLIDAMTNYHADYPRETAVLDIIRAVRENTEKLLDNGGDPKMVMHFMNSKCISDNLILLLQHNVSADELIWRMDERDVDRNFETLLERGANFRTLMMNSSKAGAMEPEEIHRHT